VLTPEELIKLSFRNCAGNYQPDKFDIIACFPVFISHFET